MVLAIGWWAILLHRAHRDLYEAYEVIHAHDITPELNASDRMQHFMHDDMRKYQKRKSRMIVLEAISIGIGLMIGLWLINRAYHQYVINQRLKQNFLMAISHELKSPIASIKLSLDSLRRALDSPKWTSADRSEIIMQGMAESNRLEQLVENILFTTKLDTGYQADLEEVDLMTVLEEILDQVQYLFPSRIFEVKVNSEIESRTPIAIDRIGFEITLRNLLENAAKYSQKTNTPVVTSLQKEQDKIILSVADQGVGIPEHEKSNIFDRFYRIGLEENRSTKGTGLGLYIVKTVVMANKGRIDVLNNESRGTIFRITWPIETSE